MQGISRVTGKLIASQEGFRSVELLSLVKH
jgi:hypothetical protein